MKKKSQRPPEFTRKELETKKRVPWLSESRGKEKKKKFQSSQATRQERLLENNVSLVTCSRALKARRISPDPMQMCIHKGEINLLDHYLLHLWLCYILYGSCWPQNTATFPSYPLSWENKTLLFPSRILELMFYLKASSPHLGGSQALEDSLQTDRSEEPA